MATVQRILRLYGCVLRQHGTGHHCACEKQAQLSAHGFFLESYCTLRVTVAVCSMPPLVAVMETGIVLRRLHEEAVGRTASAQRGRGRRRAQHQQHQAYQARQTLTARSYCSRAKQRNQQRQRECLHTTAHRSCPPHRCSGSCLDGDSDGLSTGVSRDARWQVRGRAWWKTADGKAYRACIASIERCDGGLVGNRGSRNHRLAARPRDGQREVERRHHDGCGRNCAVREEVRVAAVDDPQLMRDAWRQR